jgi:SAM-dependent methyltransferase
VVAQSHLPNVRFVATPPETVDAMLDAAKVMSTDIVYDLGCGDGRIVIAAAKRYGARGVGIDIVPERIAEANANAAAAGVLQLVRFVQADLLTADFSDATVVAIYLSPSMNERIKPRLLKGAAAWGSRRVSCVRHGGLGSGPASRSSGAMDLPVDRAAAVMCDLVSTWWIRFAATN